MKNVPKDVLPPGLTLVGLGVLSLAGTLAYTQGGTPATSSRHSGSTFSLELGGHFLKSP